MRLHFKGVRELHTNTIHSENKLLSLSYLRSVSNSPVPSTYKLSSNINPLMEAEMGCSYQEVSVVGERLQSHGSQTWLPPAHVEEVFCKCQFLGPTLRTCLLWLP